MRITVELPDNIAEMPEAGRRALEALAIEGYRIEALSPYQTGVLLGLSRMQVDGFLKDNGVWEHAYGVKELEEDIAQLKPVTRLEACAAPPLSPRV